MVDVLLDNAFKYTPAPGGTVSLWAEQIDNRAVMSVRDNGIGIAEQEHSRIFERFYRVDKAQPGDGGAGLGLSIAQWIVQQHHGKILVESTLGAGSIFRFELPLASAEVSQELLLGRRSPLFPFLSYSAIRRFSANGTGFDPLSFAAETGVTRHLEDCFFRVLMTALRPDGLAGDE